MAHKPRTCFIVLPDQRDPERGYVPSVVVEGVAGHSPLIGKGECSQPWYWGTTWEQAKQTCAKANADRGLTPDDVLEIETSSIAAQHLEEAQAAVRRVALARALNRPVDPGDVALAERLA